MALDEPNELILVAECEGAARARRLSHSAEFREATQRAGPDAARPNRFVEGIGHAPFLEDPDRFDRDLADFARSARGEASR